MIVHKENGCPFASPISSEHSVTEMEEGAEWTVPFSLATLIQILKKKLF